MKKIKDMIYVFYPLLLFLLVRKVIVIAIYVIASAVFTDFTWIVPYIGIASGAIATLPLLSTFLYFNDIKRIDKKVVLKTCLLAIAATLVMSFVVALLFSWMPTVSENAFDSSKDLLFVEVMILFVLIAPVYEEIIFRGLLYKRLKIFLSVPVSIVFSGLIFGIYHGISPHGLYAAGMGVIMAYLYENEDNFVVPVLFHSVANLFVLVCTL